MSDVHSGKDDPLAGPSRVAAFDLLRKMPGASHRRALDGLSEEDASLATEISQGVWRHRGRLDHSLRRFVHLASLDPATRDVLRIGLYQLELLDRIPDYAAVDSSVRLARSRRLNARLVNAVLRKAAAAGRPSLPESGIDLLTVTLSIPAWLARRWVANLGVRRAVEYARAASEPPRLHLAANLEKTSPQALKEILAAEGVAAEIQGSLLCVRSGNPLRTHAFPDGLFYVMGPSSHAVSRMTVAVCRPPILDCCAAPGGKLIQVLHAHPGLVVGMDVSIEKIRLVRENLDRMKIEEPLLVVADILRGPTFRRRFSTVILDAPCSGLGVIAKLPEIKWRVREADIRRLASQQSAMLENAFSALEHGGNLIYSVCSLEPEEGDAVIRRFLERHMDAALARTPSAEARAGGGDVRHFFPSPAMQDGFFAAVLTKA